VLFRHTCLWAGITGTSLVTRCLRLLIMPETQVGALGNLSIRASGQELHNILWHKCFRYAISIRRLPPGDCTHKKFGLPIRASGQEFRLYSCLWAGMYVSLGRNIRASGQEYTCFWAGIYVLLGRFNAISPYSTRISVAFTLLLCITLL
jgi:hypothetical protein